ncbi:MAG: Rne/Rng family ribonuclease [Candidatus Dependentiae bacterium]
MKKIVISKTPWQVRGALIDDGHLQDVYFDTHSTVDLERCFFKGKVSKVLPGLQTTFVDIGQEKAGFLHISEVDRLLAAERIAESQQTEGREAKTYNVHTVKKVMNISKVFSEGEDVLVQVIKEPVYEKGAKLTTCFTLPGKFIVLMPNIEQIGVSKKIENRDERSRLREVLDESLPDGMGAIVRTTAENRSANDIKKDVSFLVSLWQAIQKKFKTAESGECLFTDLPLSLRVVREHLSDDIKEVLIDDAKEYKTVYTYVRNLMPDLADRIIHYTKKPPLFERYKIDQQIDTALKRKVSLKSGGTLIVESTEAMTVIDVNTGRFVGKDNMEDTILKNNLEAAEEVVRQLRLRNIGGLIVIDFVDMAQAAHRQKLSTTLEKALKEKDKFQSVTLKVSEFGIVQMTRKRSGKTLVQQLMRDCSQCKSLGHVPSLATISHELFEQCFAEVEKKKLSGTLLFVFSPDVFHYVVHNEYQAIVAIEAELGCRIILELDETLTDDSFRVEKAD